MGLRSADEVARRIADLGSHDAYEVLDVPPDASPERIAQAYRRAMVRAHPDRGGSPDQAQLVNCAYEVLSRHREEYDRLRSDDPLDDPDADPDADLDPEADLVVGPDARPEREGVDAAVAPQDGADGAARRRGDRSPPWRVRPAVAEPDEEPDRGVPGRRWWLVGTGLVMVAAGILLGRQLTSDLSGPAVEQRWTANQFTPGDDVGPAVAGSPEGATAGTSSGSPASPSSASASTASPTAASSPAAGSPAAGSPSVSPVAVPAASPAGSPPVTAETTGHQCVVRSDASLWCWGAGRRGQLGNGALTDAGEPVHVGSTAERWSTVAVGADSTCALRTEGTLWCWGDNSHGQLGDGTLVSRATPVRVAAGSTWVAVAVGTHTCGVRSDHTLWCWGAGEHGELGDGGTAGHPAPQQVGAESTWAAVTVAEARTCAVRQNGTSTCWGASPS